jgi:hypothetical protein
MTNASIATAPKNLRVRFCMKFNCDRAPMDAFALRFYVCRPLRRNPFGP